MNWFELCTEVAITAQTIGGERSPKVLPRGSY